MCAGSFEKAHQEKLSEHMQLLEVYSLLIFDTAVKVTWEYTESDSSIFMSAQDHNEYYYQLWECFPVYHSFSPLNILIMGSPVVLCIIWNHAKIHA